MQYHPQATRSPTRLSVAMTPMIDVVFLLLIFFLCTATFQLPEEDLAASLLVRDDQPAVGASSLNLPELDEVFLDGRQATSGTTWFVNEGPTSYSTSELIALLSSIAEIDQSLPVTIEPGGSVPLEEVVNAYDSARLAGFNQVRLVAEAGEVSR